MTLPKRVKNRCVVDEEAHVVAPEMRSKSMSCSQHCGHLQRYDVGQTTLELGGEVAAEMTFEGVDVVVAPEDD